MTLLDVRGDTTTALAFAQGRATARSRGRQLEADRQFAEGTSGDPFDDFARRSMLAVTARLSFERLDQESRAFVAAYAEGVDAGLRPGDRARGAWQPWTPVAVFALHHALFGSVGHHLWRRHVARTLGPAAVLALAHEAPAVAGSNAWVVGGDRTASGKPLIGADPHRLLTVPGLYQKVRLRTDDVDVVGLTIVGVPGVQHFGHTGSVAWAITNAMADAQDVVDVLLRGEDDDVQADLGLGWEQCDVDGDVIVTRLGPVVVGGVDEGRGLVLRAAPWVARDHGLGALLPLLHARTASDVSTALDRWVDPVNDVVVADAEGTVLRRVAGLVPRRVDGDWLGWEDHRVERVPSDGVAVLANHRRGAELGGSSDGLQGPAGVPGSGRQEGGAGVPGSGRQEGTDFAPPYRARRLASLLAGVEDLTVEDGVALHADTLLLPAVDWQARLAEARLEGAGAEALRARILDWDGRMEADSTGAAAFAAVRSALVRRLARSDALSALAEPSGLPALFDPWLLPEPRIALALDRWMAEGAPFGIDLVHELGRVVEEVAEQGHPETWGDSHVFRGAGDSPVRLGGDDNCVLSTSSLPGLSDDVWRGPVARLVWCLADRSESCWTVPDETETWARGGATRLEET